MWLNKVVSTLLEEGIRSHKAETQLLFKLKKHKKKKKKGKKCLFLDWLATPPHSPFYPSSFFKFIVLYSKVIGKEKNKNKTKHLI